MILTSRNVNGLRSIIRKGNLLEYLKKYQPDIIGLQEIKTRENQIDKGFITLINNLGYKYIYFNPAERGGYGGTAIFSKIAFRQIVKGFEKFSSNKIFDIYNKYFKNSVDLKEIEKVVLKDKEGRLIIGDLGNFYFGCVYVPNAKVDLSRLKFRQFWDKVLLEYLKYLDIQKPVVICGDMNVAHQPIDLKYPKANEGKHGYTKEERQGMSNYLEAGFIDSFRFLYPNIIKYSWWSMRNNAREKNSGWRIDYCLVSYKLKSKLIDSFIHDHILGSDHAPVGVVLDI